MFDCKGLITTNPNVRSGQPCLTGTRYPIAQLFAELAEGHSVKEIAQDMDLEEYLLQGVLLALAEEYTKIPKGTFYD